MLVINHYYRNSPAPVLNSMAEWRTPEGQEKLKPMIAALNPEATMRDARASVAWLDAQKAVDRKRGIGRCRMGGPYTVRTAFAVPDRVRAAASFHGGGLVTDKPDSPHRLLATTRASYLIAIARNDDARSPADKDTLREAAKAAGRPAEIEVYNADGKAGVRLTRRSMTRVRRESRLDAAADALQGRRFRSCPPVTGRAHFDADARRGIGGDTGIVESDVIHWARAGSALGGLEQHGLVDLHVG